MVIETLHCKNVLLHIFVMKFRTRAPAYFFIYLFAYKNKYYKQIHGGAMGSAFTQVLANIYMLEWEQDLIQYQTFHYEIYGRLVYYIILHN